MNFIKILAISIFLHCTLDYGFAGFGLELSEPSKKQYKEHFRFSPGRVTSAFSGLSFVMEEVNKGNELFWTNFAIEQRELSGRKREDLGPRLAELRTKVQEIKSKKLTEESGLEAELESLNGKMNKYCALENTTHIFKDFIGYAMNSQTAKLWIAFVTSQNLHAEISAPIECGKIHICFTVNTTLEPEITGCIGICNPTVWEFPLITHMGIFRTIQSMLAQQQIPLEKPLSIYAHAFSGAAMRLMHPGKEAMFTKTIGEMSFILQNNLPKEAFLATEGELSKFIEIQDKSIKYTCEDGKKREYPKPEYFIKIQGLSSVLIDLSELERFWEACVTEQ